MPKATSIEVILNGTPLKLPERVQLKVMGLLASAMVRYGPYCQLPASTVACLSAPNPLQTIIGPSAGRISVVTHHCTASDFLQDFGLPAHAAKP